MSGYYDEMLEEIRQAVREERYEEASFMIARELRMPYIPADAEKELYRMQRDLKWRISEKKEIKEESMSSLLARLKGNPKSQLLAASRLSGRNLRECVREIKAYLSGEPTPEAAALLIEALAEQQIGEEFTYVREGVEYSFWGDAVVPVAESEGFLKADALLKEWLSDHLPDIYEMCRTLLIHEVYVFLPLSYDAEEAQDLALEIIRQVSEMMDGGIVFGEVLETIAAPAAGLLN